MCRSSEAPRMGANRTGMVFTPGWTKKPGRAAQLCRIAAECRDTARPALSFVPGPHAVFIIRKTVTPLLKRAERVREDGSSLETGW